MTERTCSAARTPTAGAVRDLANHGRWPSRSEHAGRCGKDDSPAPERLRELVSVSSRGSAICFVLRSLRNSPIVVPAQLLAAEEFGLAARTSCTPVRRLARPPQGPARAVDVATCEIESLSCTAHACVCNPLLRSAAALGIARQQENGYQAQDDRIEAVFMTRPRRDPPQGFGRPENARDFTGRRGVRGRSVRRPGCGRTRPIERPRAELATDSGQAKRPRPLDGRRGCT